MRNEMPGHSHALAVQNICGKRRAQNGFQKLSPRLIEWIERQQQGRIVFRRLVELSW